MKLMFYYRESLLGLDVVVAWVKERLGVVGGGGKGRGGVVVGGGVVKGGGVCILLVRQIL